MAHSATNKDGGISQYALHIGGVQKHQSLKRWKKIYEEHNHFHVLSGPINDDTNHCKFDTWEVFNFDELTKARKFYRSIKL